ncbi:MAG: cytochrome c [Gemmatimonadales bacterium]|nr:cytochrome c [Gemmatimonadales bacterium]
MRRLIWSVMAASALMVGCGGGKDAGQTPAPPAAGAGGELSAFEVEHGIGPIKEAVVLGALDQALVGQGKTVFEGKCTACHKMAEKYVGPALGEVTTRRSPTFIMNMILNPQEMVERHPVGKQLLAEHMTFMANQGITVEEARAIVEYLRTQATGTVKTQ